MSDGNYGLRVDHVSDLIRITRHGTYRELMPKFWKGPKSYKSADDWKLQGNDEVGREEYWSAIESYSTALELSTDDEEKQIIRLNPLKDTKGLDLLARTKEKALYRMGQAYYQLEDYSSSKAAMQALCDQFPGHQGGTPELARSTLRIAEETTAKIDFKRIYKKISKLRPPHLDHATFTGPIVVKESPGRGQGLFTIREVKAGELLLFEKAFAHCYAAPPEENDNGASKTSILINIHTNQMTMGTQSDLITTIVQKLYKNPSLVPKFQELYHGSYQPADATVCDDKPVVDTFLIERIVSHNVFGCPTLSTYNSLKPLLETGKAEQDIVNHSTGIWLKASKINHSCMSNCHRSFIGDFQIVRATCNIPADTEIHFCYRTPTGDFTEMKKELRTWGFECKCGICEESRTAPKSLLKKRKDSSMNLKRIVANVKAIDLQRLERQLKVYESTFTKSATAAPRIHIFNIYIQLARFWGQAQMPKESVAMALKGLECLGFVIHGAQLPATAGKPFHIEKWGHFQDNVDQAFVFLRDAYAVFAPQLVEKADECAKLAYKGTESLRFAFGAVVKVVARGLSMIILLDDTCSMKTNTNNGA
ncbi:putative SET and MYND domain-containing protein 3 [Glarea lozoyensis 74030]|uniref:Putative SET and MYND domain-containing protein 3 n=1 Tax=Glarea lozoyensis (strain ATCC 74030 / MF5533) TaxID=1104152 RepID=H0EZF4_GLAL7|nr:putative SET and MYND domain-containing protein 3 [Glarea lozoyensis 74030]